LLLGLDTLVSQAEGAGDRADTHHSLWNALLLCIPLSPLLMVSSRAGIPLLDMLGVQPSVIAEAAPYIRALSWSTPSLLVFTAIRRYLISTHRPAPVMVALITANAINAGGNWAFIYGKFGLPALGTEGSGWSTSVAMLYLAIFLAIYTWWQEKHLKEAFQLDLGRMRELLVLGFPAAFQILIEISIFALAAMLIGKLEPVQLAAHQVALNLCSLTFMIPLGLSAAASVRVGQAVGRGDAKAAARAGWTALAFGATFMSCAALAFWTIPGVLTRAYTPDPRVIDTSVAILFVAGFFQLFDSSQVVVTGALRGLGNTHTPMLVHLGGYWLLGLPLGYVLCFQYKWGAVGMWVGLSAALIVIGIVLLLAWRRAIGRLAVTLTPETAVII
jgi:MATE family multidrug resistance protein